MTELKQETKQPTPAEKRAARIGKCIVCTCEKFELNEVADGFPTCVCNHTQWGHKKPEDVR